MLSPVTGKFFVLGMLGIAWILLGKRLMRLDGNLTYHLAAHQRDKRKAKFYCQSVWIGLGAAILSFLFLEALTGANFDSGSQRDWVLSILRGAGLWGLMITAMVWSQVGQRVSEINSDGNSLLPAPEPKKFRE